MNDERVHILISEGLTEKAIADVLRNHPSELFCAVLALLLDPRGKKTRYRLHLKHARRGRPQTAKAAGRDPNVGRLMVERVEKGFEAAVKDAGVGKTSAAASLKKSREELAYEGFLKKRRR